MEKLSNSGRHDYNNLTLICAHHVGMHCFSVWNNGLCNSTQFILRLNNFNHFKIILKANVSGGRRHKEIRITFYKQLMLKKFDIKT